MLEALLLALVPAAAIMGFWAARYLALRRESKRNRNFSTRYFQGLNYLLSEQPDKAIEVFLEMAEVNKDTVETHLALGNLFRRRGEVDRAIRLHQNIISKHNLDASQRTKALLGLGEDYMRAGLFDRAERLFSELIARGDQAPSALRHLLDIYQQEKDWDQALEQAQKLEELTGERTGPQRAHFCCELAEQALAADQLDAARKWLGQARRHDPESVRARLIMGRIAMLQERWKEALELYEDVVSTDGDFIPLVLHDYLACVERLGQPERAEQTLQDWCRDHGSISAALELTDLKRRREGIDAAARFLAAQLSRHPSVRGLDRLIELKLEGGTEIESGDEILRAVAQRLLARQPTHRCRHCGYSGHTHYWQCPSCKRWNTTHVIHGVLGD
jgi:lipopolysaccharide biosynthesis regulator YciM